MTYTVSSGTLNLTQLNWIASFFHEDNTCQLLYVLIHIYFLFDKDGKRGYLKKLLRSMTLALTL